MNSTSFQLHDPVDAGLHPDALQRLRASIQNDIDTDKIFGATMLVARGGKLAFRATLGTVAPGRAAKEDDLYLFMSLSKSFAATLALRSVEQGHFTLDTRAAEVLPGFGTGGKDGITVHQLLTHTAGLYQGLIPPAPYKPTDFVDLEKMYQAIANMPVGYPPGERSAYTPFASHVVLAKMIMATDPLKRGFRQIAQEDLFNPLGMRDTRYGNTINDPRRVEVSHTQRMTTPASAASQQFLNHMASEDSEMPAGGAYGTIDDLLRFTEAMRNGGTGNGYRVLSPAMVDYASQNHTGNMTNDTWDAYCIEHRMPKLIANFSLLGGYSRSTGHTLSGAGFTASSKAFVALGGGSTMWMVDPERDLSVAFLSAGFLEGLEHLRRLCRLNDLAIAACE